MNEKKKFIIRHFFKMAYLTARRRYLLYFRPGYVKNSIAKRKGSCRHCPCCQWTLIGLFKKRGGCVYLGPDNLCSIFNTPNLPQTCRTYPIDEKDKTPFGKKNCGFYWN